MPRPACYAGSIVARENRFWNCHAESFLHNLPLVIMYSGYTWWHKGQSYARKKSDIFVIELVTAGNAEVVLDGRVHVVGPGEAFLLRRNGSHTFRAGPAGFLHKRMVIIEGVMLEIVLQSLNINEHDTVVFDDPSRISAMFKAANRLLGEKSAHYAWRLSLLAYEILLETGRNILQKELPAGVAMALNYMDMNLQKNLTLADIAQQAGMSMYHFSRLFSKSVRSAPMAFFQRQKMTFAKNLLSSTTLLIKEIAALLGFDDPLYFSAQFRKYAGMSPRAYRESNRSEWKAPGNRHLAMRKDFDT
ncbi:MAG: helix-turn-helix domain-containing protein [Chitinivibrionales bacterium]|nr:helix-turn-helix domain-containing protein [Chitinivibrionales bacterium]